LIDTHPRRPPAALLGIALVAAIVGLCVFVARPAAAAPHPLDTSIQETWVFDTPASGDIVMARIKQAGARWTRLDVTWDAVAPDTPQKPAGFDPANPGDPQYDWSRVDNAVVRAVAHGLEPFISVSEAPKWAERPGGGRSGTNNPDPAEFAAFMRAAALRYSGTFAGLPRVRAWELWNEVNASFFFMPQFDSTDKPLSPVLYRSLVNSASAALHAVNPGNIVIAGSLFPFVVERPPVRAIGPMRFLREMLCMTKDLKVQPNCGEPVHLDVLSHHPYTSGEPAHQTATTDSVSIRGLARMARLLRAAVRQGRIVSSRPVGFWVTEFGWDTNPPDPAGAPLRLQARWVSEALYRMWSAGVTVASWFLLRDGVGDSRRFQDGFYFACTSNPSDVRCDTPKLSLVSFRFPFVAFKSGHRLRLWARTPGGVPAKLVVERHRRGKWRRFFSIKTDRYGIFLRVLRSKQRRGSFRARIAGTATVSLPFSLKRPPDFQISPPVG
jgi:hypothetical protein